jgi:hypothetical protein
MNQSTILPPRFTLLAALLLAVVTPASAAVESGSTGELGAFNPTVNTEVELPPSGILNYTTVDVPSGVRVTFRHNATNTPVYMLATGNVTIAGTIDVRGKDATHSGTYANGVVGDDGIPGDGGPGGYAGGRGGRDDGAQRVAIIRGGMGLGPGGGPGGIEGTNGCGGTPTRYYKYEGIGGAYASNVWAHRVVYSNCASRTAGALAYGSNLLQPLVGGSGGGGGRGGANYAGSGGGGGGGAILIATPGELRITGAIDSTGGDAGGSSGDGAGGHGAGGSGGAIRLVAGLVSGGGALRASGGCINALVSGAPTRRRNCGSGGGWEEQGGSPGRIRIEADAITYSGSSVPTYVRGDVGPIFIPDIPSLRIASVAGVAVPVSPTGINDVTLPASTTGPVEIVFVSNNIPTGNTVSLKVVPAYGNSTSFLSPALSGSSAEATTQVSATLPQGPSTLQATTTYTVVVAMQLPEVQTRLARLAGDEAVERVEITAALHGGARATLVTVSGRSIELPFETVAAAGLKG